MRPCHACGHRHAWAKCPACGTPVIVSAVPDILDELVEKASVPNLAALFRRAKATGVIVTQDQGSGPPV